MSQVANRFMSYAEYQQLIKDAEKEGLDPAAITKDLIENRGIEIEGFQQFERSRIKDAVKTNKQIVNKAKQKTGNWMQQAIAGGVTSLPQYIGNTIKTIRDKNPFNKIAGTEVGIDPKTGELMFGQQKQDVIGEKIQQAGEFATEESREQFRDLGIETESPAGKAGELFTKVVLSVAGGAKPTKAALTWQGVLERGLIGAMEGARFEAGVQGEVTGEEVAIGAVVEPLIPAVGQGIMKFLKNTDTVESLVKKVTNAKDPKDLKKATEALQEFDLQKIPKGFGFDDFSQSINNRLGILKQFKQNLFGQANKVLTESDSVVTFGKEGAEQAQRNYVKEGLDMLGEYFEEVGKTEDYLKIQELRNKFVTEGLSLNEIDQIAGMFPANINSFGARGQLLKSKIAVSGEGVRSGIKKTIRDAAGELGGAAKDVDKQMSNLLTLQRLTDDLIKKRNNLQAKFMNRPLGKKIGIYIGRVINALGLGTPGGLIEGLATSNIGNKTANYVDMERMLRKNLKALDALLKVGDEASDWTFDRFAKYLSKEADIPESQLQKMNMGITPDDLAGKSADDIADFSSAGAAKSTYGKQTKKLISLMDNYNNKEEFVEAMQKAFFDEDTFEPIKIGGEEVDKVFLGQELDRIYNGKVGSIEEAFEDLREEANKGAKGVADDLLQEATFKTDKPIKVYRGQGKGIGNTTFVQGQYFADSKKFAETFGEVTEDVIPEGSKVFDFDAIKNNPNQNIIPQEIMVDDLSLTKYLVDQGYDVTKNTNTRGVEYVKLPKEQFKLMDMAKKYNSWKDFRQAFYAEGMDSSVINKLNRRLNSLKKGADSPGRIDPFKKIRDDARKLQDLP